jgi:peptidoglycan hydrolase-like protein with peptidoglycan-binding domain
MKLLKITLSIMIAITIAFGSNLVVTASQKNSNYKMPFRSSEVWQVDPTGGYGVHKDAKGFAFDLYSPDNSSREILAPIDGILGRGCTVDDSTFLSIKTEEGDILRFMHMDANTVLIDQGEFPRVKQGDILGKITGAGDYNSPNCKNASDGPHLHFSWTKEMCDFSIDGYEFNCDGMKNCQNEGVYNVPCNLKNPASEFRSTNRTNNLDQDCATNLNWEYTVGEYGMEIIKLQKCLKEKGLFEHPDGITGYFGNYSNSKLKEYKSGGEKSTSGTLGVKKETNSENQNPTTSNTKDSQPTQSSSNCQKSFSKTYKIGDVGDNIRELQQCLKDIGLFQYAGGITGYYGNYTKTALELSKTQGTLGVKKESSNAVILSGAKDPQTTIANCDNILIKSYKVGDAGDPITKLQECLQTKGFYTYWGGITGYYGSYTSGQLAKYRAR